MLSLHQPSAQMFANNKANAATTSARTGITTDGRGFGLVPIISAGIGEGKKVSASTTMNDRLKFRMSRPFCAGAQSRQYRALGV